MSTETITPAAVRKPHSWTRIAALIFAVVLLLVLGALGWLYWTARSALPQVDGTLALRGLTQPVTVSRDRLGVPAIEAASLEDLFFAQGYVTAQDRLWQMDVMRRFAAGELAEVLGPGLTRHDREQRILGLRVAAEKTIQVAAPETKAQFEAYARGVNAYIESRAGRLPIEFRILSYKPRPWTPLDSALIAAQMVKDLNHGTFKAALTREKILAKLGPDLTADLYVNRSSHDRPPTVVHPVESKPSGDEDDDSEEDDAGDSVVQAIVPFFTSPATLENDARVEGSNNWVVSGAHTVSGKPLLSNDMHLGHQMPNLWYEAHLICGDFDAAGVTLPGMPYIIVGHNRRIAWGFTNLGPTVEDVYVETFDDAGNYKTPSGWKPLEHRRETIHVKGKPDEVLDVAVTRHGPIITELVPGETRKLALRWTLLDGARNPFFAVNSAHNWEQFRKAFSAFDAPGQNVVFADVDGNIGYQATGKIPIRATGDGSLPEDGSDDRHEWTGYVPFDKLPSVYNPDSGIIATANSRITPDGYKYSLSTEWEAPWRSERIYRVLESGKQFSAADMLALQNDIYSEPDRFAAEKFATAVEHTQNASPRARQAADLMRGWDGRMSADSAAPALAYTSRVALTHLLLEAQLGRDLATQYYWGMQSVWLTNVLETRPKRWLPDNYASYDALLTAAVEAVVSDASAPPRLADWKWGQVNSIEIQHPVLGRIPLSKWTGTGVHPQSGSGYAVRAVTATHGPSERFTADLVDLDKSTLNLVTGESGNFLSPNYLDQWTAWYEGTTFALPFSKGMVEKESRHRLVLTPAK